MSRQAAILVLLAVSWPGPAPARAHGRPAVINELVPSPSDPARIFAQATWGLAVTADGGESWRWLCAAALGVDARNEDPTLRAMADGALLAGTFGGLLRSEDGGCTWSAPEPALAGRYIVDIVVGEGGIVYAVAARTGQPDTLYRSDDFGVRWVEHGGGFGDVLVPSLLVAPTDPTRLYGGGAIPPRAAGDPRRAFVMVSDDGGLTFDPRELPLEPGERQLSVWAVSPTDPDVVYGQVLHFNGDTTPERVVRSEDAGRTWETVHRLPFVGGLVAREDGSVLVGSRFGGLYRADDGRAFSVLDPDVAVSCLLDRGDRVFMCADEMRSGHALASSADGRVFEPQTRLAAIDALEPCPACTAGAVVCPAYAPDIAYDLGLDAALGEGFGPDAGTGAPRDAALPAACLPDASTDAGPDPSAPNCGCLVGGRARAPGALWLLLLLAVVRRSCRLCDERSAICRG